MPLSGFEHREKNSGTARNALANDNRSVRCENTMYNLRVINIIALEKYLRDSTNRREMLLFWPFLSRSSCQKFKNGKVYQRVTIFENSRDLDFFYIAQLIDTMSFKKK